VLLGHVSVGTDYRGIEHGIVDARIGVVVYVHVFGCLDALDVYLLEKYAERVADLYEQLALDRRMLARNHATGSIRTWVGTAHHDAKRGISSLRFGSLAGEATRPAIELVEQTIPQCQEIAYADVPIADPRCLELLELLEENGFFFGALLPGTAGSEAIRLQRLFGAPVAPSAIVTASPLGRSLLEWVVLQYANAAAPR
jgi:hypothetical protein